MDLRAYIKAVVMQAAQPYIRDAYDSGLGPSGTSDPAQVLDHPVEEGPPPAQAIYNVPAGPDVLPDTLLPLPYPGIGGVVTVEYVLGTLLCTVHTPNGEVLYIDAGEPEDCDEL